MPNDYSSNSASRRKAKTLNAQDANVLLTSSLSVVFPYLTQRQVDQVQKVLDAAVVNPVVKKEQEDLYRRALTHRAGNLVMRDPRMERRADQAIEGMIWVKEEDKHIRLNYEDLLGKNALEPLTDNPDEADYLKKVRNTLKEKGVWLRVGQDRINDPQSFVVWLSLGYDGDAIPADLGLLNREAILGNQLLGARYYEEVTQGKVQTTLESQIYSLELDIEDGEREHTRLIRRYDDAFPGVAELSDAIGGADLPGRSIWAYSKKLASTARDLNKDGNVIGAQAFLILSAVAVRKAALILSTYAQKSSDGAASVIKVLEVAKTAGEIAEIGLAVTGVAGVVRGTLTRAGAEESIDALAEKVVNAYISKNPANNNAALRELARLNRPASTVASKGSTVLGSGVKASQSSGAGTGFNKGWK